MNTETKQVEIPKKELPRLVKMPTTYKLIVPRNVEEKIRYLLRKFPFTEWSGVLFTTHSGNFEDGSLVITCKDIYPMDLGSSTFTSFNMDENVASYISDNMELFDCDLQLVHSHHQMATWFSGTDVNTLREEGAERNCFVSLIVNNEGTYNAAVTRRVKARHEVTIKTLGQSYEFFGDGTIDTEGSNTESTQVVEKEVIQYFMLDVDREITDNPFDYLDKRFVEIQNNKKTIPNNTPFNPINRTGTFFDGDFYSNNYNKNVKAPKKNDKEEEDPFAFLQNDERFNKDIKNIKNTPKVKEPSLFNDFDDIELSYTPSEDVIKQAVTVILTGSIIVDAKRFDLKQWVHRNMESVYRKHFHYDPECTVRSEAFDSWKEFIIEFVLYNFTDPKMPDNLMELDLDGTLSIIADAILRKIDDYFMIETSENVRGILKIYMDELDKYRI